ncbi:site-2 protease family protein [Streptomyces sp. V4-01]|uniref:Zinc metalloprotease n=1 Tax=Actinacidiphila polyblastidii TaxID=3110430 RepID=A0ABU7PG71_9ACTN|nr:site-2 protease family protein [Streptomyces sp. V4-01]
MIRIGSVRGVALRAHWSVPLLMLLFAYLLGGRLLPDYAPGRSAAGYAVAGVAGALLLLGSLVVHEAAHALAARRAGVQVRDITLWALGGATRMEQPATAKAAFAVAGVGPLASLVAGGVLLGGATGLEAALDWRLLVALMGWLGGLNLLLGVFNLLPAPPLDGGRVLHAALWWRTGDRDAARRTAGRTGQYVGTIMVAAGWLVLLHGVPGGLWLGFAGVFVAITSTRERRRAELSAALRGVRVAEAMAAPVATGPDWLTVGRFVAEVAGREGHSVLPLVDFEGRPSGVVRLRRLAGVPAGRQEDLRVRDVATPLSKCTLAGGDELLDRVLDRLAAGTGLPILVMDGGRLDGIVTAEDIGRIVQRRALRRPGR